MKAVFVIGTFEVDGVKQTPATALTERTKALLGTIADNAGVDADVVFVVQDELLAGRDKGKIGIKTIRAERERIVQEISEAKPDFVMCFGPVAAACVHDHGSLTEDDLWMSVKYPLGEGLPVYYTFSLENLRRASGFQDWMQRDVVAAKDGQDFAVNWGDYDILLPGTPEWFEYPEKLVPEADAIAIGFDLETYPGVSPWAEDARIRMAVFSSIPGSAVIVQATTDSQFPPWVVDILENKDIKKVGSNIQFDVNWMARFGVAVNNVTCTGVTEHVLDQSNPMTGLKPLSYKYLPELGDYARVQRQKAKKFKHDWSLFTDEEMYQYAGGDGEASIAAYLGQQFALGDNPSLILPMALMDEVYPVFQRIGYNGIAVSVEENRRLDKAHRVKMAELAKEAIKTLGPVNLNSPVKLAQAMKKAIPGINLTFNDWRRILSEEVTPELTTERKVLERESHKHPVIQTIMDYRKYDKRHGTFIKGVHDKHLVYHHGNALIHPSYLLSVAETYRPASREPNGQNFPTKDFDDPTMSVKNQFVSRFEGGKIIDADLGQVEIRVAAWLSQDKAMIAAINSGEDIHKSMAGILLNKDSADITEEERYECKTRTFLIMYGGGANRLVQELLKSGVRIGKKKAKSMIDDYFDTFSGLKDFIDKVHRDVQRDLKVVSPFGFQRNFVQPEKWASSDGYSIKRKAFNMPIQNTAAVLAYCGMIAVQNALDDRNLQAVMAMQIHDDVILDAPAEEVKEVKEILEHGMVIASLDVARRYGVDFTVPLEVEVLVGDSLGTVAKLED